MTLFITSSPFVHNADGPVFNSDNEFVKNLKEALPNNPIGLFVASYPDLHDWTVSLKDDVVAACEREGITFAGFNVLTAQTAHNADRYVKEADFIVFAGGHVPTQNKFLNDINLPDILKGCSGAAMGISAGSMNMAKTVYAQPEEAGESSPDFKRFIKGLGLTDFNILPHYQMVKDNILDGKRLYEDITFADSIGHEFIVIPDGSYILQRENSARIYGEGYMIKDGVMTKINDKEKVLPL